MAEVMPGNRLVRGPSGVVLEVPSGVASGLVRTEGDIAYADVAPAETPAPAVAPPVDTKAAAAK